MGFLEVDFCPGCTFIMTEHKASLPFSFLLHQYQKSSVSRDSPLEVAGETASSHDHLLRKLPSSFFPYPGGPLVIHALAASILLVFPSNYIAVL
jgi:hypothetical protein